MMVNHGLFLCVVAIVAVCAGSFSTGWLGVRRNPMEVHQSTQQQRERLVLKAESSGMSAPRRKPKRSLQDRTQEEAISLIQDLIQAAVEAGPRAGPARTLQAYFAVTRTIQDFLPQPGKSPEAFSAPVALRKLFERLGATYVKLGQFVASSPTLFPNEYVVEFQKCLDKTEPLEWEVIKRVIETEIGKVVHCWQEKRFNDCLMCVGDRSHFAYVFINRQEASRICEHCTGERSCDKERGVDAS